MEQFRVEWVERYEKIPVSKAMRGKGYGNKKEFLFVGCVKENGRNNLRNVRLSLRSKLTADSKYPGISTLVHARRCAG